MATTAPSKTQNSSSRVRAWNGPGILTYGYRPFFLFAGVWAVLAMVLWIAMLTGQMELWTSFDPVSWHAHEMLFGYVGAVLAGFLLTAVPNWTGRLPIIGLPLAVLAALWICGRLAIAISEFLPALMVAGIDLAFPAALAAVIGREIVAANNFRNLGVLALIVLFITANGLFHMEAAQGDYAAGALGFRMGLGVVVMMLCLIGGRIIPSFTRNWMVKQGIQTDLPGFNSTDKAILAVSLLGVVGWVILPDHEVTAIMCAVAGLANIFRLSRWRGWQTRPEPLLWILHVGFSFVALGFLLIALAAVNVNLSPIIGAQHVWTTGAIGITTLAVMSRASLGHAGLPLTAPRGVTAVYLLVITAVALRFCAALSASTDWLLYASAVFWVIGYFGFVFFYWPILTKKRS